MKHSTAATTILGISLSAILLSSPVQAKADVTPNPACILPIPFHCDPAPQSVTTNKKHKHEGDCERNCSKSGDGDRKDNHYCMLPCDFTITIPPPSAFPQPQPGAPKQP